MGRDGASGCGVVGERASCCGQELTGHPEVLLAYYIGDTRQDSTLGSARIGR